MIEGTDRETLHGFVGEHVAEDATVYTDDLRATAAFPSSTRRSSTASASMFGTKPTRTAWSHSGLR